MGLLLVLISTAFFNVSFANLFNMPLLHQEIVTKQEQAYFMNRFLKIYSGFSLMFHVENTTIHHVSYLLKLVHDSGFGEVAVINHDVLKYIDLRQRKGSPYLHIIMLKDPDAFSGYLRMPGCLISSDIVLFILLNNHETLSKEFWKMPRLSWAGNIVILSTYGNTTSLYNSCFYCGVYTKTLHHIVTGNTTDIKINPTKVLTRNFQNFYKHRFIIGYSNFFPFMLCEAYEEIRKSKKIIRRCTKASGIEIGILNVLKQKLNFKYILQEYSNSLSDFANEIKRNNNTIDFVIGGFSITADTAHKMWFTSGLAFEPLLFLYIPRNSEGSEFLDIFKPFKLILWIHIALATLWFSLSLYICIRTMGDLRQKRRVPLSACFAICFKAVIEQSDKTRSISFEPFFSPYVILAIWWLTSCIFTTAYKSKLWAISIKNSRIEPINLQELLDNKYKIVVNSENVDLLTDVFNGTDPIIVAARKQLVVKENTCSAIEHLLKHRAAMLDEYATIQYHAVLRCYNFVMKNIYLKLRLTRKHLRQTTHAWPLQIGAPYKNVFDEIIGTIHSAGLPNKWKSEALSMLTSNYEPIPFGQSQISEERNEEKFLQGFASAFTLYIIGNFIALMCLIYEIIRHRNRKVVNSLIKRKKTCSQLDQA